VHGTDSTLVVLRRPARPQPIEHDTEVRPRILKRLGLRTSMYDIRLGRQVVVVNVAPMVSIGNVDGYSLIETARSLPCLYILSVREL
jgi:hypothetical protein